MRDNTLYTSTGSSLEGGIRMRRSAQLVFSIPLALVCAIATAQVKVTPAAHPEAFLNSTDAKLARNKRLVYDFWRDIVDAGRIELIDKYVAENYIQHNPNTPSGRAALVEHIAKTVKRQATQPRIKAPVVSIVAEGDLVVVSLVSELADPANPAKTYTTTWFDMFRIENGKIVEHWDSALHFP